MHLSSAVKPTSDLQSQTILKTPEHRDVWKHRQFKILPDLYSGPKSSYLKGEAVQQSEPYPDSASRVLIGKIITELENHLEPVDQIDVECAEKTAVYRILVDGQKH